MIAPHSPPSLAALARGAAVPLALLLMVLGLYGDALGYAFMYDDGLDLARGEDRSIVSLLTSGEGAFYFRPLPFVLWKGMHALLGSYDPFWFHLLPLIVHAVNAWLLYKLARTLGVDWVVALLASALFVVFPFHYQAVPWAGALFHPLVTALVLGSLLCYVLARRRGAARYWLASAVCAGLALLTHESAVMLGVLAAGLEIWLFRRGEIRRPGLYPLIYLGLAGAFAIWWLAVPKWPRAFNLDPDSLGRNTLMYLQALVWPLALTWRWAPPALLAHPELTVGVLGSMAVAAAAWCFASARRLEAALLGVGWLVVTALPVWATLPTEYLEDGARLYYLPSIGIALSWALLAQAASGSGSGARWRRALVGLVLAGVLAGSVAFVVERRPMYAAGTELLRQAAAISSATPADTELLFVNLPAWQAPRIAAVPLGNTGVTWIPEYVLLDQALHVNGGGRSHAESLATHDLPGGWPAHYGPHGEWASLSQVMVAASARAAYVADFAPPRVALAPLAPETPAAAQGAVSDTVVTR